MTGALPPKPRGPVTPVGHLADLLDLPEGARDAIFRVGKDQLRAGLIEMAIDTFIVSTQLDPMNPIPWRALAEALREDGQLEKSNLYAAYAEELAR